MNSYRIEQVLIALHPLLVDLALNLTVTARLIAIYV